MSTGGVTGVRMRYGIATSVVPPWPQPHDVVRQIALLVLLGSLCQELSTIGRFRVACIEIGAKVGA